VTLLSLHNIQGPSVKEVPIDVLQHTVHKAALPAEHLALHKPKSKGQMLLPTAEGTTYFAFFAFFAGGSWRGV
jgi:hypothetical protein